MYATPTLSDGEIYVATIQVAGEAPYHLILLPDHPKDNMTHLVATEWAATVGGDLPTRPEQALLFVHQRDQFDLAWYWSNSLHEYTTEYAWRQYFGNGCQEYDYFENKLRARAVRREYF